MARYRKIDPRVWRDEKFVQLDAHQKLIAIYCLTSAQTNRCGIFSFSQALAAEDLGMPIETFRERFGVVTGSLGWRFDEALRVLFIPNWWRYNRPDNPNLLQACMKDLHELPLTSLLAEFYETVELLPTTFRETFRKRYPQRYPVCPVTGTGTGTGTGDNTPLPPKGGSGRKRKPAAVIPEIPLELRTPEFTRAWDDWQRHRRESGHRLTPTATERQLAKLADWGPERAVAALEHTMANGWQGIFEPKGAGVQDDSGLELDFVPPPPEDE